MLYREGASMADHMNAFHDIINRLFSMGISFEDQLPYGYRKSLRPSMILGVGV